MAIPLSSAEILALGLEIAGFDLYSQNRLNERTKLRRFRSNYGCCPEAFANILHDLRSIPAAAARLKKPRPSYLLMVLHWLKTYKTYDNLTGFYEAKGIDTVEDNLWKYIDGIHALRPYKVRIKHQSETTLALLSLTCQSFSSRLFGVGRMGKILMEQSGSSQWMAFMSESTSLGPILRPAGSARSSMVPVSFTR